MREKSEAQLFLESYELNKVKMECKLEERQFWHDLSLCITGQMNGERVQSSGVKSKIEEARDVCMEMEEDVLSQVKTLADSCKEVTGVIDKVSNPTELKLLHQKYIQFKDFNTIAVNFNSDYTWATTCHGRALKSVAAILEKQ